MREFSFDRIPKPKTTFNPAWIADSTAVDLEIGAGAGLHAIRYCQSNPSRALLAVEKTHKRFAALVGRKLAHQKLTNLHVFHADAVAFVSHCLPDSFLNRVFLLYPNPYPKEKHSNLRWYNRPFMGLLIKKMKPGAELILATNMEWYSDQAASAMSGTWHLDLLSKQEIDFAAVPRTHFEKKYLARQERCWNLVFRKG